nr:hypothetical protein GCM10020093_065360 [Planobispora longispora]
MSEGEDGLAVAVVEPSWTDMHVAYREGSRHPLSRGAAGLAILALRGAGPVTSPPRASSRRAPTASPPPSPASLAGGLRRRRLLHLPRSRRHRPPRRHRRRVPLPLPGLTRSPARPSLRPGRRAAPSRAAAVQLVDRAAVGDMRAARMAG